MSLHCQWQEVGNVQRKLSSLLNIFLIICLYFIEQPQKGLRKNTFFTYESKNKALGKHHEIVHGMSFLEQVAHIGVTANTTCLIVGGSLISKPRLICINHIKQINPIIQPPKISKGL